MLFRDLPTADYILSPEVGVERKDANDFILSIMDKRLFGQAARLRAEFDVPILIIEGDLSSVRSQIDAEAVRGAVSCLPIIYGVTVLQVKNAQATADMIRRMAIQAQHGLASEPGLRSAKPKESNFLCEYLVEGLPGVSTLSARKLLAHFGTPRRVFCATEAELLQVPGFGKSKVQQILKALETHYVPKV